MSCREKQTKGAFDWPYSGIGIHTMRTRNPTEEVFGVTGSSTNSLLNYHVSANVCRNVFLNLIKKINLTSIPAYSAIRSIERNLSFLLAGLETRHNSMVDLIQNVSSEIVNAICIFKLVCKKKNKNKKKRARESRVCLIYTRHLMDARPCVCWELYHSTRAMLWNSEYTVACIVLARLSQNIYRNLLKMTYFCTIHVI